MDFLLILLVAWALYTVYKSIKAGAYIYIAYLIVFSVHANGPMGPGLATE